MCVCVVQTGPHQDLTCFLATPSTDGSLDTWLDSGGVEELLLPAGRVVVDDVPSISCSSRASNVLRARPSSRGKSQYR